MSNLDAQLATTCNHEQDLNSAATATERLSQSLVPSTQPGANQDLALAFKMLRLLDEHGHLILLPDFLLRGATVHPDDFEELVEQDEEACADPRRFLDYRITDTEFADWCTEFNRGHVDILNVGTRVRVRVPGTNVDAYLHDWLGAVEVDSDSHSYIEELHASQRESLTQELQELGVIMSH